MNKIWDGMKLAAGAVLMLGLLKVWFVDPWAAVQIAAGLGLIAGVCDAVAS